MEELKHFIALTESTHLWAIGKAGLLFIMGYFIGRATSSTFAKLTHKKMTAHGQLVLKRSIFYGIIVLFSVSALRQLGLDLSVVLGAAGILSVAIGFASQTSASNLISGLFLMIERPFSIADVIRVNNTTGEVISIDLLSVKLRTFDNLFVRIPNETMIKSEVTTMTKYPIRRIDLQLGIAYKEDIDKVKALLFALAEKEPLCLEEPPPLFILNGFGSSSIDIQFSIWAQRANFLPLKNAMLEKIKKAFDQESIEIPYPHVSLYTGSITEPFPIKLVEGGGGQPS